MSETKFLKCTCQNCGGHIEYPAEAAGMSIECPHCRWQTELRVEVPEIGSVAAPRRRFLPLAIALLCVLAALAIAAPILLKRAALKKRAVPANTPPVSRARPAPQKKTAPAVVQNDFEIRTVSIDAGNSSLRYATGTLRNLLAKQRFSVRVEIECLDGSSNVVASASDYIAAIEPNGTWNFRALIIKGRPVAARVSRITEQE
jgi:hypothetical protein